MIAAQLATPPSQRRTSPMTEQSAPTPAPPASRIRVLLVDDVRDITMALQRCIEGEPDMEAVGTLESADHLVAEVERTHADVVLLDMTMPGKDPLEAVRELTAAHGRDRAPGAEGLARVIVF